MFLALKDGQDGQRIEALVTGDRATCPQCRAVVIAKCGHIVTHHWAHEAGADCDTWSEGMTRWHLDWQGRWPELQREFVIGEHRADVVTVPNETPWLVRPGAWRYLGGVSRLLQVGAPLVVEFQHSSLPVDEIEEREAYYGNSPGQMIWVWDCCEAFETGRLYLSPNQEFEVGRSYLEPWQRQKLSYERLFKWKHFPSTRAKCRYPAFLDLGTDEMLFVREWPEKRDVAGPMASNFKWEWGWGVCCPVSKQEFVQALQIPGRGDWTVTPETSVTSYAYSYRYGLPCDLSSLIKLGKHAKKAALQAGVSERPKVLEGINWVNAWPGWVWSLAAEIERPISRKREWASS